MGNNCCVLLDLKTLICLREDWGIFRTAVLLMKLPILTLNTSKTKIGLRWVFAV